MVFKRLEIDDVHCLFHMERAKFSVRALAVIIVHTVGHVAALLHFADDATRADGVHRSRLDEEAIPFLDGNKVEELLHRAVLDFGEKLRFVRIPLEAAVNARTLVRAENVPHFRLAVVLFHAAGIFVIGVDLHGQILCRVYVFDEHGERRTRLVHRLRIFGEIVRQCSAFPGAQPVGMDGHFPAFAHLFAAVVAAVHLAELHAAPKIIFENGI